VFADLTAATDALAIWRGAMEALALRYALIAEQFAEVAPEASRIVASGGVVETTPGWLQVVADALGRPVDRGGERNATMLGTASLALEVLAPDVPRATPAVAETFVPVAGRAAHYGAARKRQDQLYTALVAAPNLATNRQASTKQAGTKGRRHRAHVD
jgi:gluconokinase